LHNDVMRTFYPIFMVILVPFFAACSKTSTPPVGAPEAIMTPATGDVAGPRFSQGPDQTLVLSWMERGESETTLKYSAMVDSEFNEAFEVVREPRMFVNWADLPSVMPVHNDYWVAHWLRYSADKTYSYDVVVSQSFDRGETWGESSVIHSDGTPTEHGFVSIASDAGSASLLWLDGRFTPDKAMTLRAAVLGPDGKLTREQEVDSAVCDCCQTDIAIAASGAIAAYRDRSADEVRDIYISRNIDGRWSPGKRLYADNWYIPGCPVNGPSIVANGDRVAVAWFSAANDRPVVRVVRSTDSGGTFEAPLEVASGGLNGYVGLAEMDEGQLAVSWVAKADSGDNVLRVRTISNLGEPGPTHDVATIRQLRVFPQLAFNEGHLWFAWTDDAADQRNLFVARMPGSALQGGAR
jgi:hypothetical protein